MDCSNIKDVVDLQVSSATYIHNLLLATKIKVRGVEFYNVVYSLVLNCQVYMDCTPSVHGL